MADDLTERLREITPDVCGKSYYWAKCVKEAADELEAARKRIAELEAQVKSDGIECLRIDKARIDAEAELADKAAERLAYDAVIDLLFERLPDAKCMGELPGVVDELLQQLAAVREALYQARREIEYLRHYGNKDCTHMADKAMAEGALDAAIDAARGKA